MVSIVLGSMFTWCLLGVVFLTDLGIQILEGRGLQSLLICCCYLQWLGHVWQLCVVFYIHFDTLLILYCFLQWIWHMGNSLLFFTINWRLQSDLVVFYKSLLCCPILRGPGSQVLAIWNHSYWDIPICNGSSPSQPVNPQYACCSSSHQLILIR